MLDDSDIFVERKYRSVHGRALVHLWPNPGFIMAAGKYGINFFLFRTIRAKGW
jgi:hypothetical protein